MMVRFQISVSRRTVVAWVKLAAGTRCNEEIVKFEVLAENPGGVFTRHVKSWN